MAAAKGNVIEIYRGDTYSAAYTLTSGAARVDITNYSIKFMLKARVSDADADALIDKVCEITDGAQGIFTLSLTKAETATLPPASGYVYDIQISSPDGTWRMTLANTFKVNADVRRDD